MAVVEAVMVEESLQLSSMPCVSVTKSVLEILDLINSELDFHALVSVCVDATDNNCHPSIGCIAFNHLTSVFKLQSWRRGWRPIRGFQAQRASLLHCPSRTRQRITYLQA